MMKIRYQARMHPTLDILCDSLGRVFVPESGHNKEHWTFGSLDSKGYRTVKINYKTYKVARLICEAFHGLAPEDRPTCDHINRVRDWNIPENLRWSDYKQQADNTRSVDRSIAKYGVRKCDDPKAYGQAYRTKNPEKGRDRQRAYRAKNREKLNAKDRERRADPKVAELDRARCRAYYAEQKALGRRSRACPDGKRRLLTDEEYDARFGINRQLPLL